MWGPHQLIEIIEPTWQQVTVSAFALESLEGGMSRRSKSRLLLLAQITKFAHLVHSRLLGKNVQGGTPRHSTMHLVFLTSA